MVDRQFFEQESSNFMTNGYSNTKYRIFSPSVELHGDKEYNGSKIVEVPSRIEVLTSDHKWQQFPVVFIHGPSYKTGESYLVIFLSDGNHYCIYQPGGSLFDRKLYREAGEKGLTQGRKDNICHIVKEDW
ncbi:MAG: hypothetical protein V1914_00820 [archaeon]